MMRETLAADARQAAMIVSPGKGLAFQRRPTTGGESVSTAAGAGSAPYFVKLTRAGATFTAYKSLDGVAWTTVGTATITMPTTIYVGVAVSSHVAGHLAAATFGATTLTQAPAAPVVTEPVTPGETDGGVVTAPGTGSDTMQPTGAAPLRVLHWNLHHGNDPDNHYALARQMDVIYQLHPDVVSLNEVEKNNKSYGNEDQAAHIAQYLTDMTGQPWYYFMRPGTGAATGIGNAVISRLPFVMTDVCQLSAERNAVHATMMVNGRTFNMWSTHLAVETSAARVSEANALTACMSAFAEPRLVTGDFNSSIGTPELNLMTAGYVDGWAWAKSLGTTLNFAGNCDGCTRNTRLDYAFSSKMATMLEMKSAQIFDTRDANGVMASDHKPMLVIYDVK
jgi:endonuclease/exonuclease/phosphatase family metal-dependent hydrolase